MGRHLGSRLASGEDRMECAGGPHESCTHGRRLSCLPGSPPGGRDPAAFWLCPSSAFLLGAVAGGAPSVVGPLPRWAARRRGPPSYGSRWGSLTVMTGDRAGTMAVGQCPCRPCLSPPLARALPGCIDRACCTAWLAPASSLPTLAAYPRDAVRSSPLGSTWPRSRGPSRRPSAARGKGDRGALPGGWGCAQVGRWTGSLRFGFGPRHEPERAARAPSAVSGTASSRCALAWPRPHVARAVSPQAPRRAARRRRSR